jgi:predicted TIM-barrel fold metal-dependent hydrolase
MLRPPPLSCDCHIHVFGPFERYPLAATREYTPEEATLEDYLKVAHALGTGRVVLVQPSVYGTDNSCQRDAILALGERARGIAVIDETTTDEQLRELNGAGFEGARLNLVRAAGLDSLERLAARVKEYDWHVQLHLSGETLQQIAERLLMLPTDFVIDHFGRIEPRDGPGQPAFQALLGLLDSGRCWRASWRGAIPSVWCGAATGRIRTWPSCRRTRACSTRSRTGFRTRRRGTASSWTIPRSCTTSDRTARSRARS